MHYSNLTKDANQIHFQALLGHPQMLGRPGLGSFPHAARRMLSLQDISNDTSNSVESNTDTTEKTPKLFQLNTVRNERGVINIKQSDRKQDRYSSSTHPPFPAERSDRMKYQLPQPQRSLLWSPPQIITSVLKVFRKVYIMTQLPLKTLSIITYLQLLEYLAILKI